MIIIKANQISPIPLGHQGENMARKIAFDISGWRAAYGAGKARLIHQRTGDTTPYPVTIECDGNMVYWPVRACDTACAGVYGRAELRFYKDNILVKSGIYRTAVQPALEASSDTAPDVVKDWIDNLIDATSKAEKAVEEAVCNAAQNMEDTLLERINIEPISNEELEKLLML